MSRKHCKRTHYALIDPVKLAISGACITDTKLLDRLRIIELSALQAWKDKSATDDDLRTIRGILNLTSTMAEMGIGEEAMVTVQRADAALDRAERMLSAGSPMIASQSDVQTFQDLYEYHDLQRLSVDRSTYERAILSSIEKMRSERGRLKACAERMKEAA